MRPSPQRLAAVSVASRALAGARHGRPVVRRRRRSRLFVSREQIAKSALRARRGAGFPVRVGGGRQIAGRLHQGRELGAIGHLLDDAAARGERVVLGDREDGEVVLRLGQLRDGVETRNRLSVPPGFERDVADAEERPMLELVGAVGEDQRLGLTRQAKPVPQPLTGFEHQPYFVEQGPRHEQRIAAGARGFNREGRLAPRIVAPSGYEQRAQPKRVRATTSPSRSALLRNSSTASP